ncbi:hypothetical protein FOA52_002228 [Chlamydomonas sp. UWO 241]|nr:hypothetical protein FOA52_002228 [Chlamydomonas sp. UWO 241]
MGFLRAEEVTLPIRFFCLTLHFIAVLVVVFGLDSIASNLTQVNPNDPGVSKAAVDDFNGTKNIISGFSYGAIACFSIEYITLFLGVTIFMRHACLLNIMLHFFGLLLVVIWVIDIWSEASYIAFITVFSFLPAFGELLVLALMSRFTFAKY